MRLKVGTAIAVLALGMVAFGSPAHADSGDPATTGPPGQTAAAQPAGTTQTTTSDGDTAQPPSEQQSTDGQSSNDAQQSTDDEASGDTQTTPPQNADQSITDSQVAQPSAVCPNGRDQITGKSFVVNGATTLAAIYGQLHAGDHVVAHFTVADGCSDVTVQFVAFQAQGPNWVAGAPQTIFSLDKATFGPGEHTLQIDVPMCYFQVDFTLIDQNGKHLIMNTATGGTQACSSTGGNTPPPPNTGGYVPPPPPDQGGTGETPPPPEVGGETVTSPVTPVTPPVTPVVMPQVIEQPVAQPAVQTAVQPATTTRVLGNEITRTPRAAHAARTPRAKRAPHVEAATLARTGQPVGVELMVAFALLLVGGAFVEAGRRRAASHP